MSARRYPASRGNRFLGRRGAPAVEFAITAPILILLLFMALELGRMNMIRNTANNAAYEAARTCVVPGATSGEGVAVAENLLSSIGVSDCDITITPETLTDTTPSVTATVTVPYGHNLWLPPLYSGGGSASASYTMACEWLVSTRQSSP